MLRFPCLRLGAARSSAPHEGADGLVRRNKTGGRTGGRLSLEEEFAPRIKSFHVFLAIRGEPLPDLLDRLLSLELRFTVKLIGKADQLLLKAYGQHVVGRDGQVTCLNHRARESRAGVTLTNERVTGIA